MYLSFGNRFRVLVMHISRRMSVVVASLMSDLLGIVCWIGGLEMESESIDKQISSLG